MLEARCEVAATADVSISGKTTTLPLTAAQEPEDNLEVENETRL